MEQYQPSQNQPEKATQEQTAQAPHTAYTAPVAPYYAAQYPQGYYVPNGAYAPYMPPAPKKKLSSGMIVFLCIVAAVLVFGFGVMVSAMLKNTADTSVSQNPDTGISEEFDSLNDKALTPGVDSGNNDLKLTVSQKKKTALKANEIAQKSQNSVLGISVYSTDGILKGEASGVVAGENAAHTKSYIITCAHVITDSEGDVFKIVEQSGKEYLAAVIGYDASCDVGVLSVERTGFDAVEFGDSSKLNSGETVIAVGNPGGSEFFGSVTQGIVSATDRIMVFSDISISCIQHDAAINPGSSGGALFNMYGQVIGINYSKIALDDYEGMNFSIPSKTVVEKANRIIAENLKTYGAKIGIEYYVSASYFDDNYKQLIIHSVDKESDLNGKAEKGDFIIAVNGKKITDKYTIVKVIMQKQAGDEITLTIARKNDKTGKYDTEDIVVKLIEKKASK